MNKKILIFIALVVVGLGIGTVIGLSQIKQTPSASGNETKAIESVRTDADRLFAIDKIKSLFGKDLTIIYTGSEAKYYSYGIPNPATVTDFTQLKTIETYTDNQGFTIKVDITNNDILSKTKDCIQDGHRVTNDEAKMIAEGLLAKITGNSEGYKLTTENKNQNIYSSLWEKTHVGQFYNIIPSQKERTLAGREERTIAICLKNGELMTYEYKPALTEQEITTMAGKWNVTQSKDTEILRKFLKTPDKQFTFVNYMSCSQCGPNGTENSFRVYKDESGYCYDLDKSGNVTADTEIFGQCKTPIITDRSFNNDAPPNGTELAQAEQAIRTFMGKPNLELLYKGQNNHPDNFAILGNIKVNAGGFTADNPEEWDRPVYIFEQSEYINDRCEVYRYQVSQKTNQVVEIGIVYPEEMQQGNPTEMQEKRNQCSNYGSLETPLKTKDQIEQAAYAYMSRDPEHTTILLKSSIAPKYTPSKQGATNPAQNEWSWEDESISLPAGLTGDPWQHPIIRIVMSSGGKLIYYLNTTGLFSNY